MSNVYHYSAAPKVIFNLYRHSFVSHHIIYFNFFPEHFAMFTTPSIFLCCSNADFNVFSEQVSEIERTPVVFVFAFSRSLTCEFSCWALVISVRLIPRSLIIIFFYYFEWKKSIKYKIGVNKALSRKAYFRSCWKCWFIKAETRSLVQNTWVIVLIVELYNRQSRCLFFIQKLSNRFWSLLPIR